MQYFFILYNHFFLVFYMCVYPKFCCLPWLSILQPQISVLLIYWRYLLSACFHHMLESPAAPRPTEQHQAPCAGGPKPWADITEAACEPDTHVSNDCRHIWKSEILHQAWVGSTSAQVTTGKFKLSLEADFQGLAHNFPVYLEKCQCDQRIFNSPDLPRVVCVLNHTS